jgi:hypothetical protein
MNPNRIIVIPKHFSSHIACTLCMTVLGGEEASYATTGGRVALLLHVCVYVCVSVCVCVCVCVSLSDRERERQTKH